MAWFPAGGAGSSRSTLASGGRSPRLRNGGRRQVRPRGRHPRPPPEKADGGGGRGGSWGLRWWEVGVGGNLPPDAVVKVFKNSAGALRACYEHGLKRNPNLQFVNNVNAHFAVKNTGAAINVGFSPHADGEMEKCMAQAIEKWRFPTF